MPIYEFKCINCGKRIEFLFRNSDDQLEIKCASCGSVNLERVFGKSTFNISGPAKTPKAKSRSRTCGGGSCTTYEIPGHRR